MKRTALILTMAGSALLFGTAGYGHALNVPTARAQMGQARPSRLAGIIIKILSVRVERYHAKADWSLAHPPVTRVRAGTRVTLSIYYRVRNAPAGARVVTHWRVMRGRHVVLKYVANNPLGGSGTYRDSRPFKLRKVGTYTFRGRVTISGHTAGGRTSVVALG